MNKIKIRNNGELEDKVNDAFDMLRVNMEFADADAKTIVITSPSDKEGKSLISFQLACNMAENDKRVLLIMADFRKSIAGNNKQKTVLGMSEAVLGKAGLNDTVFMTDIPNLFIMFAGKQTEDMDKLVSSPSFEKMLKIFKNKFDYILFDSASVINNVTTSLICSKCDGTILIIEQGETSYEKAFRAKEQIELTGCKIIGTVINAPSK